MKIVGIGELVWDLLPSGPQLGGAPVNFAFFAKGLGAEAYPVTAIGRDALGEEALGILRDAGLDTSLIQFNGFPTGTVKVSLDAAGIPSYDITRDTAWDNIACPQEALEIVRGADAVCWGSLAQRSPVSRTSILELVDAAPSSCKKVFDINLRQDYYSEGLLDESLRRADILKLNEDELPVLKGLFGLPAEDADAIGALIRRFSLEMVIHTCGAVGSSVYTAEGPVSRLDTPKVEVADTVGAGDSFTAAFVTALLGGSPVAEAHALAVRISAYVCTRPGAINSPTVGK